MAYELWDTETRNIVGDYETEGEALAIVRDVLRLDGQDAVASLALAHEDRSGRTRIVAIGRDLGNRALNGVLSGVTPSGARGSGLPRE